MILQKQNIVLILQARMDSARLPGKVMEDIAGKPMIWHIIERLKACTTINKIVVATSSKQSNNIIMRISRECGVEAFSGSEEDVLDRYYRAVAEYNADIVVRVCGDCPLIDPAIIDKMVLDYVKNANRIDYLGMGNPSPCPYGLDAEVFSFQALEKAWHEADLLSEREHVTPYIWKNTGIFRIGSLQVKPGYSDLVWSVDNKNDLEFVRAVYKYLYKPDKLFLTGEVISLLKVKPEIADINKTSIKKEGYYKSLDNDKKV